PQVNLFVIACRHHRAGVARERQAVYILRVRETLHFVAALVVPHPRRRVPACGEEMAVVWMERERPNLLRVAANEKRLLVFPGSRVPDAHALVAAARGDIATVVREGDTLDFLGMPFEFA